MKDINDILKLGETLKVKVIDYDSPEAIQKLKNLKKQSEACLKNKFVNWDKLSRTYITI